jgi:hypothetical protein
VLWAEGLVRDRGAVEMLVGQCRLKYLVHIHSGGADCDSQWHTQELLFGGRGVQQIRLWSEGERTGIWGGSSLVMGSAQFANECMT